MRSLFFFLFSAAMLATIPQNIGAASPFKMQASSQPQQIILAGGKDGLFSIKNGEARASLIWQDSAVKKIIRADDFSSPEHKRQGWYFLTDNGVFFSGNLRHFEPRNLGLPFRTLKTYEDGKTAFVQQVEELFDLAVLKGNPSVLVTVTTKSVFLSEDGGLSWRSLGRSAVTEGIKTAAPVMLTDNSGERKLAVFMSHPIYGVSYIFPGNENARWTDINAGLEKMPTMDSPDEVASFAVSKEGNLYASQSFIPAIYKLNWQEKRFDQILRTKNVINTFDGLSVQGEGEQIRFFFTALNSLKVFSQREDVKDISAWNRIASSLKGNIECIYVPPSEASAALGGNLEEGVSFSKMWLLNPTSPANEYTKRAAGKKGIYIPVWQATTDAGLNAHLETIRRNNLNMLVIDMKDDYGVLRYNATDSLVLEKGEMGRGIQLESFVQKAKAFGIYLVARIVVFKDRELYRYGGGKYAVWDRREHTAWRGYTISADGATRNYYDEYWVDPYSEEVWEYNVAVAKELVARGFDEIQFDYIRFPTDGRNLDDAAYRWQSNGMDKESALISFLAYARQEIRAPISIDIYGANGWYRTGSRTGQHIELISKYVDVICPMFYPSHFENGFLAQEPASQRPYRIYYFGSWRNTIIAGNNAIVRPWAQAFYLNVSYDRQYYNEDYVQAQVFGVRDSINLGYTYWNNSGRYTDLRPD